MPPPVLTILFSGANGTNCLNMVQMLRLHNGSGSSLVTDASCSETKMQVWGGQAGAGCPRALAAPALCHACHTGWRHGEGGLPKWGFYYSHTSPRWPDAGGWW